MPKRAVFFDRDGTLMDEVHYCNDPSRVRAIPGTASALAALRLAGWLRIIITNQSGIASGKILPAEFDAVQAELLAQLDGEIDATFCCPDASSAPGPRRKPAPGMLIEAAECFGLDLSACWMVGDKSVDIACGHAAGCRTILVRTGYGHSYDGPHPTATTDDVPDAVHLILSDTKEDEVSAGSPSPFIEDSGS